jgi:hypothetical protein
LVLDVSPSHQTNNVKKLAQRIGMELLFVSAGATERLQPLNRRIFGELKSRVRVQFSRLSVINGEHKADYELSLQVISDGWGK